MTIIEELEQQVKDNPVLLYMKGSPEAPQCGFSSKASQILISCESLFLSLIYFRIPKLEQIFLSFQIGLLFLNFLLMENL